MKHMIAMTWLAGWLIVPFSWAQSNTPIELRAGQLWKHVSGAMALCNVPCNVAVSASGELNINVSGPDALVAVASPGNSTWVKVNGIFAPLTQGRYRTFTVSNGKAFPWQDGTYTQAKLDELMANMPQDTGAANPATTTPAATSATTVTATPATTPSPQGSTNPQASEGATTTTAAGTGTSTSSVTGGTEGGQSPAIGAGDMSVGAAAAAALGSMTHDTGTAGGTPAGAPAPGAVAAGTISSVVGVAQLSALPAGNSDNPAATASPAPTVIPSSSTTLFSYYVHHISALGTWRDPTTGATLSCERDCSVVVVPGTPPVMSVQFDDAKPGQVLLSSPDKAVRLFVKNESNAAIEHKIPAGGAGKFSGVESIVQSTPLPEMKTGVASVVTLEQNVKHTLSTGTAVECTQACTVVLGSDGNVSIGPQDLGSLPTFKATVYPPVDSPGKIQVTTLTLSQNTNSEYVMLPITVDTTAGKSTTVGMTAPGAQTGTKNAPGALAVATEASSIVLSNGATVRCADRCNVSVGRDGGVAIDETTGTRGNVQVTAGEEAVNVYSINGANGKTVKLNPGQGVAANVSVNGILFGSATSPSAAVATAGVPSNGSTETPRPDAARPAATTANPSSATLSLTGGQNSRTFSNGVKVTCDYSCEVTVDKDGRMRVVVSSHAFTQYVKVEGGAEDTIIVVQRGENITGYRLPANAISTFGETAEVGIGMSTKLSADSLKAPFMKVVDASGKPTNLPGGVEVACYKDCKVVVAADGSLVLQAADGDMTTGTFEVSAGSTPVKVVTEIDGRRTTYEVVGEWGFALTDGRNTTRSKVLREQLRLFANATNQIGGVSVQCNRECTAILDDEGNLKVVSEGDPATLEVRINASRQVRLTLEVPAGTRTFDVPYKIGEYRVFTGGTPGASNPAKLVHSTSTVQMQVALLDGVRDEIRFTVHGELLGAKGDSTQLRQLATMYGLDVSRVLAEYGAVRAIEDVDPDGHSSVVVTATGGASSSSSSGGGSLPALGSWPALLFAVGTIPLGASSLDTTVNPGATYTLTSGALSAFNTGFDDGTATSVTGCGSSECTDAATIRWGYWSTGSANISLSPLTINSSAKLHYIIGSATDPATITARSATANYNLIGGTTPTGADGRTYTATAGLLTINFNGTATPTGMLSSYGLTPNSGVGSYSFSSISLSVDASGTTPGVATLFGTGTSGTASLTVNGAFFGTAGNHIGAAMNVHDTSPATDINGVHVFKEP